MTKRIAFQCANNPVLAGFASALLKKESQQEFQLEPVSLNKVEAAFLGQLISHYLGKAEPMTEAESEKADTVTDYIIYLSQYPHEANNQVRMELTWDISQPTNQEISAYEDAIAELKERIAGFILVNQTDLKPLPITPTQFYKQLADDIRLKSILLIISQGELCVCELMAALEESQPKISRHLAQLRKSGVLLDRRKGQWVYYRLNPNLASWMQAALNHTYHDNTDFIALEQARLEAMDARPDTASNCC